jgi:GPR endopeptidase
MHEIDLSKYNIRTDLISDTIDDYNKTDGITVDKEKAGDIEIIRVVVEEVVDYLDKKPGKYVTIAFEDVTDKDNRKSVINVLTKELKNFIKYMKIKKSMKGLVIGLGNDNSTPDSVGPKVIDNIIVTKHIFEIEGIDRNKEYRNVSAFAPGVFGTTGIETMSVIKGIINETNPDFLVIVDALASSSIDRVNKTIQITDAGISPGSGVGNMRGELSKETLGIPVLSLGVPTVVDAVTIVSDTINFMFKKFGYSINNVNKASEKLKSVTNVNYLENDYDMNADDKRKLLGILGDLSDEEIKSLIFEVLTPVGYNLMVTPKEVDFVIDKLSLVIGQSINNALHNQNEKK